MGLLISYGYTNDLALLRQHFPCLSKSLYQCHLVGTFEHLLEENILPHNSLEVFYAQCFALDVLRLEFAMSFL